MKPNRRSTAAQYYPFLDGVRAIAIIWVLVHHLDHYFKVSSFLPQAVSWNFERFAFLGTLGVDMFFVTSGFLISGLLLEDIAGNVRAGRFYLRRFFKIVPQYVVVIVTSMVLAQWMGISEFDNRLWGYFVFLQGYLHPIGSLSHLWSIAAEEAFYVFYPGLIILACMACKDIAQRKKVLLTACLILMFVILVARRQTFQLNLHSDLLLFQMPHMRMDELLAGCVIKLLEPFWTDTLAKRCKFFPAACFLLSAGLFYYFFRHFDPGHYMSYVYVYVACGALLVSALCGFGPLVALFENRWLRGIGKSSYAIYLWHYPLIFLAVRGVPRDTVHPMAVFFIFIFLIVLGILSTMTVEKYFLRLRNRLVP